MENYKIFKVKNEERVIGFVERNKEFKNLTLASLRRELLSEIHELIPSSFRFLMKGMPISSKQENHINISRILQSDEDGHIICIESCKAEVSEQPVNHELQTVQPKHSQSVQDTCTRRQTLQTGGRPNIPFEKTKLEAQHAVADVEEDLQVAKAQLESLQQSPTATRPWHGKSNFTCTNCHFKGHKVSKPCDLPSCRGYNECGIISMHPEQRAEINKIKQKVKTLEKKFKEKQDELESLELIKGRTQANFFSVMRPRLINSNPVKYSSRQSLENDLRVLAAACKHIVPNTSVDLEDAIDKHKQKSNVYTNRQSSETRSKDRGYQWRQSLQIDYHHKSPQQKDNYRSSSHHSSSINNNKEQHRYSVGYSSHSDTRPTRFGPRYSSPSPPKFSSSPLRYSPYQSPATPRHNTSSHSHNSSRSIYSPTPEKTARREVMYNDSPSNYSSREAADLLLNMGAKRD